MSLFKVTDTTVMVISSKHGADIGTEVILNYVDHYNKPTVFVINKIDSKLCFVSKSWIIELHKYIPKILFNVFIF